MKGSVGAIGVKGAAGPLVVGKGVGRGGGALRCTKGSGRVVGVPASGGGEAR